MAIDKAVDSAVLDAGLTATANAIRGKTGDSALIEWKNADGFKSAVDAIQTGGGGGFPNGTKWYPSNITSGTFYNIEYANGVWVALGYEYGTNPKKGLYYSTDGMTWTQSNVTSGTYYDISIKYADGIWVVANGEGLYYSMDGIEWELGGSEKKLYYIAHGNGLWVASGPGNIQKYSSYSLDGKTWNRIGKYSDCYDMVYYADGIWVTAYSGSGGGGLYYSTDGMTWTQSNVTSGYYGRSTGYVYQDCIVYGNGVWVMAKSKDLYYSTDGMTWTQCDLEGTKNTLCYVDGMFFLTVDSHLYYSTDGMTWNASNIEEYGFLVYKSSGIFVGKAKSDIYYSVDGINWIKSNIPKNENYELYYECCCANGVCVASGDETGNNLIYSTDGMTWLQSDVDFSGRLYAVRNANGMWVAGSESGLYYSPTWLPT